MISRITKNENRLDKITKSINKMNDALDEFNSCKRDLYLLNRYYGSNNWFKDKDSFEKGSVPKVKAGVLSEDAVWNMLEEYSDLIKKMKNSVKKNR